MPSSTQHTDDPRVCALLRTIAAYKEQLGDQDADAIVQRHIKLLHTYNETKDATQRLIGITTQKTVTQVHTELNLPLTE